MDVLLTLHALSTIMMTGLIWFVQVVHYPLFSFVGGEAFARYEQLHTRRVTWIVAPLMGIEVITAITLLVVADSVAMRTLAIIGLALVVVIWTSTAFLQVPCHRRLAERFDPAVARRLVTTNWVRTAAWTARACLALSVMALPRS